MIDSGAKEQGGKWGHGQWSKEVNNNNRIPGMRLLDWRVH